MTPWEVVPWQLGWVGGYMRGYVADSSAKLVPHKGIHIHTSLPHGISRYCLSSSFYLTTS